MIYGYIRVSTEKQTLANQRYEIKRFCQQEHLRVDRWVQETISGTKPTQDRELGTLLESIRKDDLIICAELSRLGRNMFFVMNILHTCMEKQCRVWSVKEGYRLGDDLQSKVLAFAFGMAADIEHQFISARTREALARKKSEGMRLGRKPGSHNKHYKLDEKAGLIRDLAARGMSCRQMAHTCGVSRSTLLRWKARNDVFGSIKTVVYSIQI